MLLREALWNAWNLGARKSMLWVGEGNISARALYEKVGYVLDEKEAEVVFYHKGGVHS